LSAEFIASSVALNGKAPDTTWMTLYRPADTAPDGTSARKAIGSDSMNASREAARTSLVIAPIARPIAANASAAAAMPASMR
jgi:hypothetical protein